jgi:integrase
VRRHRTVPLGRCRTKTAAKQKLRAYIADNKVNDVQTFNRITAPGLTFRQQAKVWLESLRTRRRRPLKPSSIENYEHYLDKRLLSLLGDLQLSDVGNRALKMLVEHMSTERKQCGEPLSPKTVVNYVTTAKLVIASAVDAEGEALYPRKWNDDFIGVPVVVKAEQRRQTVSGDDVTSIIARSNIRRSKGRYRLLFALLPGSGIRIGEALALKPEDFSSDCRVIHVTHAIWKGKDQPPKTASAVREVDIVEELAALVREYIANIPAGCYLFATASGTPLSQRNALRILHALHKVGFHAFRRFRTSLIRKAKVPGDVERLWLGHASRSVTDDYARQLREDLRFRQEWTERTGLGFSMTSTIDVLPCSTTHVTTCNFEAA